MIERLARNLGGTVEAAGRLPDGSGFAVVSYPLPNNHWLTAPGENEPPMPWRAGTAHPQREPMRAAIVAAARYAIRATTANGTLVDYDPDALVQNLVVGLLGYHTPTGLSDL
jgi:hypothetical protein